MNIETKTQTITVTTYTLTLTEAELTAALVDPAALQTALRDARAGLVRARGNGRHNLVIGRKAKPKKEKSARAPKAPAPLKLTIGCPDCPKRFKNDHALRIHRARGHKVGSAADAAKSSASA